ncbi:MAG: hypothetical protein OXG44_04005 [Gammaproteobacteria bacterium]|nr:hypothetical protein [Gammaproteobacteria bacterium]
MKRIRRFGHRLVRAFHTISAEAFLYYAFRREIRLERQTRDQDIEGVVDAQTELASELTEPILERFENRERERRKSVEAKARTNLVAISLAAAIATALFSLVSGPASHVAPLMPTLLDRLGYAGIFLGWIYLVSGGFFAFQVLDVQSTYLLIPRDYVDLDEVALRAKRIFYLEQNQRGTRIMTNALAVSFAAIRNGIVAFVAGMGTLATQLFR